MPLVAACGVALLLAYARKFCLVVGYDKINTLPILRPFLSRLDELLARVRKNSTSYLADISPPIDVRNWRKAHRRTTVDRPSYSAGGTQTKY